MRASEQRPIGFQREHLDTVDSTNTYLKARAALGAPHGLVVTAGEQTAGRGRFGRSFLSAGGKGLYLSLLLRPDLPAAQAAELTPWTAVAVCRALEGLTGLRPTIKWINDILLEDKKLCGILTEAAVAPDGSLEYVVVGIGLNLTQDRGDFPPDLAASATSLAQHLTCPPSREALLDALLRELNGMWAAFPSGREAWLEAYRARCSTLGREVDVISPAGVRSGLALCVGEDFSLSVRFSDGSVDRLNSGEVSLRPLGAGSAAIEKQTKEAMP